MSEYIKKEDAFTAIEKGLPYMCHDECGNERATWMSIKDIVNGLPTYSFPEREKGEWEQTRYRSVDQTGETYDDGIGFRCSNCANAFKVTSLVRYNFCPNCGADMRGKSCNTCKNSNDDFSGECYECVKNIQNHYEPQESEEDFPQAKDIEPTVKGFADTMDIIDRICEKEGE